jgi:hypothetical protein
MDQQTEDRPHVIKDAKGKRPQFYDATGMDQAMSMIMVLANELAVLHDRIDAHERVTKKHNIDLAAEIEQLELDEDALHEREAWRQNFLDRLFYLARKESTEAANAETRDTYNKTIDDIAKG